MKRDIAWGIKHIFLVNKLLSSEIHQAGDPKVRTLDPAREFGFGFGFGGVTLINTSEYFIKRIFIELMILNTGEYSIKSC